MTPREIAEALKDRLTMKEVASFYGFSAVASGEFIACPFHSEKTASCKLYKDSFYCFGCGAGGDVVKFVQMLFNVTFMQAVQRLNADFALRLPLNAKESVSDRLLREQRIIREVTEKKVALERRRLAYMANSQKFKNYLYILEEYKPPTEYDLLHPLFVEALHNVARLRTWLDENIQLGDDT